MSALEGQYRRLLRWYPKQWRARNEAAVTGALLDEAEHEGRMRPSVDDTASLVLGGLRERFLRVGRPSLVSAVGLIAAVAFSLWYVGVIAVFGNPSTLTAGVFVIALALVRWPQLARIASVVAALTALGIFALAESRGWMGPGPAPTSVFIGLGLIGAIGGSSRREAAILPLAVALAGISVTAFRVVVMSYPVVFAVQFWIAALIGIAAGAAAVLILAITTVNRAQLHYAVRQ